METYNVRIKDYLDGQQVTIYSNAIKYGDKKQEEQKKHIIYNKNKTINPFTGEPCVVEQLDSMEEREKKHNKSVDNSIKRTKNQIVDYARSNIWEWFLTITFKEEEVRNDYSLCTLKLSKWLNNMQTLSDGNMKYIAVPETHKKGGYHFHLLVSGCTGIRMVSSGRWCVTRKLRGKKKTMYMRTDKYGGKEVFNCGNYQGGFSTATKIEDSEKASNYIQKYITKDLVAVTKGKKRYWVSKNLKKPVVTLCMDDNDLRVDEMRGKEQFYKRVHYQICEKKRFVEYYEMDEQFFKTN